MPDLSAILETVDPADLADRQRRNELSDMLEDAGRLDEARSLRSGGVVAIHDGGILDVAGGLLHVGSLELVDVVTIGTVQGFASDLVSIVRTYRINGPWNSDDHQALYAYQWAAYNGTSLQGEGQLTYDYAQAEADAKRIVGLV